MPGIARLKANATRITDLAKAIEDAQQTREFHARTGHSELHYEGQDAQFGLTIQHLELMHPGDNQSFVTAGNLHFKSGEWTLLVGESGSGKSSLLKAINGLWPHGRGTVVMPRNVRTLYAAQEIHLPQLSLKALMCLPDAAEAHSEAQAAGALNAAGLASFVSDLAGGATIRVGISFFLAVRSKDSSWHASFCCALGSYLWMSRPAPSTARRRSRFTRPSETIVAAPQ